MNFPETPFQGKFVTVRRNPEIFDNS
jgi:hypothetical protein